MRVLAIGAGRWGANIIRTLHGLNALAGVVESHDETRAKCATNYPGVPMHASLDEALNDTFDAATIATPAPTHFEVATACLNAGLHTFVEKPMTLAVRDAEVLNELAQQKGRVLMAGHLLLYQPAVQFLKSAIRDGKIGELISIHQERLNLGRARNAENVLWSLGVHDVAVAQFLVGAAPVSVSSSGKSFLNRGIEDDVYLHVEFEGGVQSNLHCSWLWPTMRRQTTVIGSKAMLVYDEVNQTVTLHDKHIDGNLENVNQGESVVFEGAGQPLELELSHFLECARTGKRPDSDGSSAIEVVKIMERATKSPVTV